MNSACGLDPHSQRVPAPDKIVVADSLTGRMTSMAAETIVKSKVPQVRRNPARIAPAMLAWYDAERRRLPWRVAPGYAADPYKVWLSEVMLQQTVVKAAIPYYAKFLELWPTLRDLAAADLDDVMAAWAGLGYYSRARNLHACARAVASEHGGVFPGTEEALLKLPGIGPYTAAAIAAIAFGQSATVVDGNVERVVSRLFAVTTPLPASKPELKTLAATLTPSQRAGDFAQAMMDLGATICTPKRPSCMMCPIAAQCRANAQGIAATLPVRAVKSQKPRREAIAFVALREDGKVLLRKRPDRGLLARMMEVPTSEWVDSGSGCDGALETPPVDGDWWRVPGSVTHVFTHFHLQLDVYRTIVPATAELTFWSRPEDCRWVARDKLAAQALPSLMRKVLAHAMQV